jgi:hypothetical protein
MARKEWGRAWHIALFMQHTKPDPFAPAGPRPLKVGTLSAILSDVAGNLKISREDLNRRLFG